MFRLALVLLVLSGASVGAQPPLRNGLLDGIPPATPAQRATVASLCKHLPLGDDPSLLLGCAGARYDEDPRLTALIIDNACSASVQTGGALEQRLTTMRRDNERAASIGQQPWRASDVSAVERLSRQYAEISLKLECAARLAGHLPSQPAAAQSSSVKPKPFLCDGQVVNWSVVEKIVATRGHFLALKVAVRDDASYGLTNFHVVLGFVTANAAASFSAPIFIERHCSYFAPHPVPTDVILKVDSAFRKAMDEMLERIPDMRQCVEAETLEAVYRCGPRFRMPASIGPRG